MAYDEGRVRINGEALPIECIRRRLVAQSYAKGNLHYHDYTELLFGLSGTALVLVRNSATRLFPGSLIVIQAGEAHDVQYWEKPCEYLVVKFLPQLLISAEQTGAEFGYALALMEQAPNRQSIFSSAELDGSEIPSILCRMMEEWDEKKFGYELSLRADVTRVILFLLRKWKENCPWMQEGIRPADRTAIQRAMVYIGEHYVDLCEKDVAEACGISTITLSRLFARVMKSSYPDYLCGVRLREAEKLLLTTELTVTEIALQVGFSTAAYFIAKFRHHKGITPYRFRRDRA